MLHDRLAANPRVLTAFAPELDIVVWALRTPRVSTSSDLARHIFTEAARQNLHLALAELPLEFFDLDTADMKKDRQTITCLRSVLMKPEHLEWLDRIWHILNSVTNSVIKGNNRYA
jgi:hypothetical protein